MHDMTWGGMKDELLDVTTKVDNPTVLTNEARQSIVIVLKYLEKPCRYCIMLH